MHVTRFGVGCAVAIAAVLLLGGCMSSAEITRMNAENDKARCSEYGFKPGTEAFAKCRFDLDRRREDERNALLDAPIGPPVFMSAPDRCWNTPWGLRCETW
ncbi:hypothetical protein ACFFJ7_20325 [Pseudochelatococcus lubricantis]|uniref:hypothetical protein n=1 Tax=Pseudochelatococcus lubricantis TaxID=1538102 RepID=UPI0035EE0F4F